MNDLINKEGLRVPDVSFKVVVTGNWEEIKTSELFAGKTVVLFSLPGAMTPTCSNTHLPEYEELYETFRENGVDEIVCLSVNDTFVMNSWAKEMNAQKVKMLPDGNGEFTDKIGMLVDKSDIGFGRRSWRYSMLVKNSIIEKMFIEPDEPGDPFKVSDAHTMLNYINSEAVKPEAYTILTRVGCPYCEKAKDLMKSKSIDYNEIVVGNKTLRALSGKKTYPQVFKEGVNIGGYDDIVKKM